MKSLQLLEGFEVYLTYCLSSGKVVRVAVWSYLLASVTPPIRKTLEYHEIADRGATLEGRNKEVVIIYGSDGRVCLDFPDEEQPKAIDDFEYQSIEKFNELPKDFMIRYLDDFFALLYKEADSIGFVAGDGLVLVPIETDFRPKASWGYMVSLRVESMPMQGDGSVRWPRDIYIGDLLAHVECGDLTIIRRDA